VLSGGDDFLENLILEGAVEVAGIDRETGEPLFSFTDKLEEVAPHIFRQVMEEFHRDILDLWVDGFLEMNISDPQPLVKLTPRAFDEEAVSRLSKQQRLNLSEIIAALRIDE
jgi:hypothetical protein